MNYALMLRGAQVAQAAKPADEAKPRPVRKKNDHPAACGEQSSLGSPRYV
jgi:hypothetical protein